MTKAPVASKAVTSAAAQQRPPLGELPQSTHAPLIDRFGRIHRSLRISVTDACNIRCQYCMPAEQVQFLRADQQLSMPQFARLVRALVPLGVRNFRITGGEPLVRRDVPELLQTLSKIEGVEELALTTNGMLLAEQLPALVQSGLQRVNISLDTLSDATFKTLSRRVGLDRVLAGIDAAVAEPRLTVKLNALVLRDVNLEDVYGLVEFAKARRVPIRFIEYMPLDAERKWNLNRMVSGEELRGLLSDRYGPLHPVSGSDPSQPSSDYQFADGGQVGFIDSVSRPFCGSCDRLRVTADGRIRNCLFGREEWNVASLLRGDATLEELQELVRAAVQAKYPSHGIANPDFQPPERAMYQIGG
jgi:cyclic pyranopterin phosphate synthase